MVKTLLIIFCLQTVYFLQAQKGNKGFKLSYNPDATAKNEKGFQLFEQGKFDESIPYFIEAIKLNDIDVSFYENLFAACGKAGNYKVLKEYYTKAKSLFENNYSDLFYFSGDAFQKLKKYNEAIESYSLAIEIGGNKADLLYLYYFNRGNVFLKTKKYKSAINDYNKTLIHNEKHKGAYTNMGMALFNTGNSKEGCKSWRKAYTLGNKKALSYISKYCK